MSSHHVNELGELELDLDGDGVRDVLDGSDELVVSRQDLIIQSLGVRVASTRLCNTEAESFRRLSSHSIKVELKVQVKIQVKS